MWNGASWGSYTGTGDLTRYNRYNESETTLEIKTGGLDSTGQDFRTVFKHS